MKKIKSIIINNLRAIVAVGYSLAATLVALFLMFWNKFVAIFFIFLVIFELTFFSILIESFINEKKDDI